MNSTSFNYVIHTPPYIQNSISIKAPYNFTQLTNLTISSSGLIKVYIKKNGHVMAVLFNSSTHLNIQSLHTIDYTFKDNLEIVVENRDKQNMDVYIGAEAYEAIPNTKVGRVLFSKEL